MTFFQLNGSGVNHATPTIITAGSAQDSHSGHSQVCFVSTIRQLESSMV